MSRAYKMIREEGAFELARAIRRFVQARRKRLLQKLIGRKTLIPKKIYFQYGTIWNQRLNKFRYKSPADPYATINVNPKRVDHKASKVNTNKGLGQIINGGWDTEKNLQPIEDVRIVKGLRQRFEEGREWKNTIYYKKKKETLESRPVEGYTSAEEYLNVRCKYVDELFSSIRDDGYRPNFEADHEVPKQYTRNTRYKYKHELEPLVAIGRNGEIHWREGFHRLIIAQILGIESIPVHVLARHSKWQKFRDNVKCSKDINEDCQEHPDLQDLI